MFILKFRDYRGTSAEGKIQINGPAVGINTIYSVEFVDAQSSLPQKIHDSDYYNYRAVKKPVVEKKFISIYSGDSKPNARYSMDIELFNMTGITVGDFLMLTSIDKSVPGAIDFKGLYNDGVTSIQQPIVAVPGDSALDLFSYHTLALSTRGPNLTFIVSETRYSDAELQRQNINFYDLNTLLSTINLSELLTQHATISSSTNEIIDLRNQNTLLKAQIEELRRQIDVLSGNSVVSGQVAILSNTITDLLKEKEVLEGIIRDLRIENATLVPYKDKVFDINVRITALINKTSLQFANLVSEINGGTIPIVNDTDDILVKISYLENAFNVLISVIGDLKKQIVDCMTDSATLQVTIVRLNEQISGHSGIVTGLNGQITQLQQQINTLGGGGTESSQITALNKQLAALQAEKARVDGELSALKIERDALANNVLILSGDKSALQDRIDTLEDYKIKANDKIANLESEKNKLTTQISELTLANAALINNVKDLTEERDRLGAQVIELTYDKGILQQQILDWEPTIEQCKPELLNKFLVFKSSPLSLVTGSTVPNTDNIIVSSFSGHSVLFSFDKVGKSKVLTIREYAGNKIYTTVTYPELPKYDAITSIKLSEDGKMFLKLVIPFEGCKIVRSDSGFISTPTTHSSALKNFLDEVQHKLSPYSRD